MTAFGVLPSVFGWGNIEAGKRFDPSKADMEDSMADCLFCKIIAKEIPTQFIYEDENVVAFRDINPAAPHHYLVLPREHIPTVNEALPEHEVILGRLFSAAARIAKEQGFSERGYRCIVNCNADAGQVIFHLHMHLLAGKKMGWSPV